MSTKHTQSVVLVTGGTGLVGSAIQHIIETEPVGSRFGRREDETWVFVTSKDADLRCVSSSSSIENLPLTWPPPQGPRANQKAF